MVLAVLPVPVSLDQVYVAKAGLHTAVMAVTCHRGLVDA